jgi:glycine dehydrogenase subunit 2
MTVEAIAPKPMPRRFHQASWDEPIIFELSTPGARGVLTPPVEPGIRERVGDPASALPAGVRRQQPPALPELAQIHVLRHYARLSQENLGVDLNIDVGQGTCTMKYSPKVNDQLVRSHRLADVHPAQPESTIQGVLEIAWRLEQLLRAISGMDRVTLQPGAGSAAIYANVSMIAPARVVARGPVRAPTRLPPSVAARPWRLDRRSGAGDRRPGREPEGDEQGEDRRLDPQPLRRVPTPRDREDPLGADAGQEGTRDLVRDQAP